MPVYFGLNQSTPMRHKHSRTVTRSAAALRRAAIAERWAAGRVCSVCNESRAMCLLRRSNPVLCFACARVQRGLSPMDKHHLAGRANSPFCIHVNVNDHAVLSELQRAWPSSVLRNPSRNPVVVMCAWIFALLDWMTFAFGGIERWTSPVCLRPAYL